MADFCKQCSIDLFGEDFKELAGEGRRMGLCEGCGIVIVDPEGECVDPYCKVHGTKGLRLLTTKDILELKEKMEAWVWFPRATGRVKKDCQNIDGKWILIGGRVYTEVADSPDSELIRVWTEDANE